MKFIILFLFTVGVLCMGNSSQAASLIESNTPPDDHIYDAVVEHVVQTKPVKLDGTAYYTQTLRLNVKQDDRQRTVTVATGYIPRAKEALYNKGDTVLVGYQSSGLVDEYWYVIGHKRSNTLVWLAALFCLLALVVTRKQGLRSLVAMALTGLLVLFGLLPLLFSGVSATLALCGFAGVILPINFYLSHGVSKKTSIAVFASVLIVMSCILISQQLVNQLHLTGLSSAQLQSLLATHGNFNLAGLVVAGVVISILGVIDDITITQASIVHELAESGSTMTARSLYTQSMNVGRDHIASVINTLILVYAGSNVATILLMTTYPRTLTVFFNTEEVSTQLLIMLLSSISLIVAIPMTSALAAFVYHKK